MNIKLTKFQAAQLLHFHCTGDFSFNKWVSGSTWLKMVDAFVNQGLIRDEDGYTQITLKGRTWADDNHLEIDLRILEW